MAQATSGAAASVNNTGQEQPIRVLLISDLPLTCAGLRYIIEKGGLIVVAEASSCGDALDVTARERPDVILIDLDSQHKTCECIDDLGSRVPGIPLIALSDRAHVADHAALVEIGASGLVLKNEPPETLITAIRKVRAGEVWLNRSNIAEVLARLSRRRRNEDADAAKIATLTRREREIVALIGDGLRNSAIAERLFISEATVRNHLTSILDKLELANRFELAVYAFRHGLTRDAPRKREREGGPSGG